MFACWSKTIPSVPFYSRVALVVFNHFATSSNKLISPPSFSPANTGTVDYSFKVRKYKHGVRFEGEKKGGEISLFEEVAK